MSNEDYNKYVCERCGAENEVPTTRMRWLGLGWMRCERCGGLAKDNCAIDGNDVSMWFCPVCGAAVVSSE